MSQEYLAARRLYLERDEEGLVRALQPAERNRATKAQLPQQAAAEFLVEHADLLALKPAWLSGAEMAVATKPEDPSEGDGIELRLSDESPSSTPRLACTSRRGEACPSGGEASA